MDALISQSGSAGVFLTPKSPEAGSADGAFRIIWLDTSDLPKALSIAKLQGQAMGVVRGRGNLGIRVKAEHYIVARQVLNNCKVAGRYIMALVPSQTDRESLQGRLLLECRSPYPTTWLFGGQDATSSDTITISGEVTLFTKQHAKDAPNNNPSTVLAAPASIRKTLDRQLRAGARPIVHASALPEAAQAAPAPVQPSDTQVEELRTELQQKLNAVNAHFQASISSLQETLTSQVAAVSQAQSDTQQNVEGLETKLQTVADNVCP